VTQKAPAGSIARLEPTEADPEPSAQAALQAGPDEPERAAPQPLRKKRRKRKGSDGAPDVRAHVPPFATAFPREPDLDRLVDAFERGNYALVRAGARRLAEEAERDEVRRAARELLRRIDPDPLATLMLAAAAALLAFLAAWYWSQGRVGP
jgi:hypothetical protein